MIVMDHYTQAHVEYLQVDCMPDWKVWKWLTALKEGETPLQTLHVVQMVSWML